MEVILDCTSGSVTNGKTRECPPDAKTKELVLKAADKDSSVFENTSRQRNKASDNTGIETIVPYENDE